MNRFVPALALLLACDESTTPVAPPPSPSAVDASAAEASAPSYPTEDLGWRVGAVIPDVTMRGRRPDGTFGDVAMEAFWDPEHRSHALVVLVAGWAEGGLTHETTSALVDPPVADVLVAAVLSNGAGGTADEAAANAFALKTRAPFVLLDPKHEALGALFDEASSPFVTMLDARTMKIVYAAAGAVTPDDVIRIRDGL